MLQDDGNLVLYIRRLGTGQKACWSSGTAGSGANELWFQADGNLVLKRSGGSVAWASNIYSGCAGADKAYFTLQNDGNFVMRYPNGDGTRTHLGDTNTQNQQTGWKHQIR
ncbi:D-mannose binding lectin [compost metagenome]